ncbi:MAG: selenium-dependent molybdenum cofactor biosynthesis protein YqeB [Deltaproteobacteria bacterium]|nr:selenium-dependent molybdenum cofactor biosynthesis protein YqeB [Deltaproteobacteria bacterium]
MNEIDYRKLIIVIKGAGEMASGIGHRLYMSGMRRILMTEIEKPLCIRRTVSFSEAIYEGEAYVEGVKARKIEFLNELNEVWSNGEIGVIVDPEAKSVTELKPDVLIDATMAKRYTGTKKNEAPIVICIGPGFKAPDHCHAVIESQRGHNLGRVIYQGEPEPHTGIPVPILGHSEERVLRAPHKGTVRHVKKIGDLVKEGDLVLYVDDTPLFSKISGILRGLIKEIEVDVNEKIADIDPTMEVTHCYTISEKARAIAGGVLEAILHFLPSLGDRKREL